MTEEASLEFRLRKNDETRNDLLDEINDNDLMSEKYKIIYKYLNYWYKNQIQHFFSFWLAESCLD